MVFPLNGSLTQEPRGLQEVQENTVMPGVTARQLIPQGTVGAFNEHVSRLIPPDAQITKQKRPQPHLQPQPPTHDINEPAAPPSRHFPPRHCSAWATTSLAEAPSKCGRHKRTPAWSLRVWTLLFRGYLVINLFIEETARENWSRPCRDVMDVLWAANPADFWGTRATTWPLSCEGRRWGSAHSSSVA